MRILTFSAVQAFDCERPVVVYYLAYLGCHHEGLPYFGNRYLVVPVDVVVIAIPVEQHLFEVAVA